MSNLTNNAERGVRILDAAADVEDLLRLAHEAVHRIHQDVSNDDFDHVELMSKNIHQLRAEAKRLNVSLQEYVREMEPDKQFNPSSQKGVREIERRKH